MKEHKNGAIELTADEAARTPGAAQCGTCKRWWDDSRSTAVTPAPSGRCPFEYEHAPEPERPTLPPVPLFRALARALQAHATCQRTGNAEWERKHMGEAKRLVREHLPHGAGFDSGTELDDMESTSERLVFRTAFHHMNEGGFYDGWTEHKVIVRPSLAFDFTLTVGGRDRNGIKEYVVDCFDVALRTLVAHA